MDVEALVVPEIIPEDANRLSGSLHAQMNKVAWLMWWKQLCLLKKKNGVMVSTSFILLNKQFKRKSVDLLTLGLIK